MVREGRICMFYPFECGSDIPVSVRSARFVTRKPILTGFHEVPAPLLVDTLRYAVTPAQLSDIGLATQPIQHSSIVSSD